MLNKNQEKRDSIIKHLGDYSGGCARFEALTLGEFEKLVDENFIDLQDSQNDSPCAGTFLAFMREFPGVVAHGYTIEEKRNDYRVTIEGLSYNGKVTKELRNRFVAQFRLADDFEMSDEHLYCWWD